MNSEPRTEENFSLAAETWYIRAALRGPREIHGTFSRTCAQVDERPIAPSANGCSTRGDDGPFELQPLRGVSSVRSRQPGDRPAPQRGGSHGDGEGARGRRCRERQHRMFTGETGAKCLDLPGREHGRAIHLLRALEATMGDERETNLRIDAALRQGATLVCVKVRRRCQPSCTRSLTPSSLATFRKQKSDEKDGRCSASSGRSTRTKSTTGAPGPSRTCPFLLLTAASAAVGRDDPRRQTEVRHGERAEHRAVFAGFSGSQGMSMGHSPEDTGPARRGPSVTVNPRGIVGGKEPDRQRRQFLNYAFYRLDPVFRRLALGRAARGGDAVRRLVGRW